MKNNKVVLVGKASLAAAMAASLVTPVTAFAAEELPIVEKMPEATELMTTEPSIDETYEAEPMVALPTPTPTPTPTPEEPKEPEAIKSSLPQANRFAPSYVWGQTTEQLKTKLSGLITDVETMWTSKGGYKYYKNNQDIKTFISNIDKAKKYLEEGLSTAETFSWRVYEMESAKKGLSSEANVLTPKCKEIYALNAEKDKMDESLYSTESWKAYTKALTTAMEHANGSGFSEETLQQDIDKVNTAKAALEKLSPELISLNALVSECKKIMDNREDNGCTKKAWNAFALAYAEASSKVKEAGTKLTQEEVKTLLDNLAVAKDGLVQAVPDGEEAGIRKEWKEYYATNINRMGGFLYVSGFKTTAEGTEIQVTFENNGLDPVTGKKFINVGNAASYYGFNGKETTRELKKGGINDNRGDYILNVIVNGHTYFDPVEELTKQDFYDGFTTTILVPKESEAVQTVDLDISQWNSTLNIPALGTYYAPIPAPEAEVKYSTTDFVRGSVTATIETNLELDEVPEGWTKVSETVYTKEFKENAEETVILKANGKETEVKVTVMNIVKAEKLEEALAKKPAKEQSAYTPESWDAYQSALNNAQKVMDDAKASQKDVDKAVSALNDALAGLKEKETVVVVNKDALKEAIKEAEALKPSDYVQDGNWNKFQVALKSAKEVLADANASQKDVDQALKVLNFTKSNLKKAEDKKVESNTALGLHAGLFATLLGSSALGAAILESLKRKNRK